MTDPGDTRLRWIVAAALAAAGFVAWWTVAPFGQGLLAEVAIFAVFAMAVDLAAGVIGLMSIGHAMYFGLGAYGVALLTTQAGLPPGAAILLAVAATFCIALLVGAVIVRFDEIIFIILSLALSEMFYSFIFANRSVGGSDGIPGVPRVDLRVLGLDIAEPSTFAAANLLGAVAVFVALDLLVRSPFGLIAVAVRQNATRARALGTPINRVRSVTYALSAAIAALAGAAMAELNGFVSPDLASWTMSGLVLIMAILGGLGSISGAALGAVIVQTASHFMARWTGYWAFYLGLIFVSVVLFAENGIFALLRRAAAAMMRPRSGARADGEPTAASPAPTRSGE